jgi:PAS domain S-box-containing protein
MSNNKFTVLVVDDMHANRLILEDLLTSKGINVISAANGEEAVKTATKNPPDLILMDILMPVMDGFETCSILKEDEKTKNIPIIFLTGLDHNEDIIKGFGLGAVDYVTKPFRTSELYARVMTHLDLKHSRDVIEQQNQMLMKEILSRKKAEKELKDSEVKYSSLITGLSDAVFKITYPEGTYEYISPAADKVFGFSKNNFYKNPGFIKKIIHPDYLDYYINNLETQWGVSPTLKYKIIDPEGNERWIIQANKGTFDKDGNLVVVEGIYRNITTEQELEEQKNHLEKTNKKITSSIRYAHFIQKAVLPSGEFIKQFIPENFILFIPRDIVSGDFYWIKQVKNHVAVAAADCTGHGVPGAFMSMLGIALLNEIVRLDESPKANEILNELRKRIKTSLHQDAQRDSASDGMDISLCIINLESKEAQYAGANSPMYIVSENNSEHRPILTHIKPDRMPIGVYVKERAFTNHVIKLGTNDVIYLFSDGFQDQFGGQNLTKFKTTRFKALLEEIYHRTLNEQREILYETFENWRAGTRQLDDVLVIGVRILDNYGNIDFFD